MVTALCVVGQHPIGLDLQLRNLRWAIKQPMRIVVFTFRGLFKPEDYPGVEFVEVEANPREYYCFHTHTVGQYLYKYADDVVVMNELDTFFSKNVDDHINKVRNTGEIHVGSMSYWYDVAKDNKIIMPRLWEGGLIIQARQLNLAHHFGVIQGQPLVNPIIISRIREHDLRFLIGLSTFEYGAAHKEGGIVRGDNYTAMNIVAYLMGYKIKSFDYLSHIKAPETVHRHHPDWYDNIDEHHEAAFNYHREKGPGTVFHLFLFNKASPKTLLIYANYLRDAYWNDIIKMLKCGQEWMPPEMYQRLRFAARIINGIC